jgi:hypothetical protein
MRPDRPLIIAAACLAAGVGLIIKYCQGATSMNAAYPITNSTFHLELTTNGPAALGGLALVALSVLLLAWSVLGAIFSQIALLMGRNDSVETLFKRERGAAFEDEHYPSLFDSREGGNAG